jgi:phenylalanyl-tRNA synthetase beta subunit
MDTALVRYFPPTSTEYRLVKAFGVAFSDPFFVNLWFILKALALVVCLTLIALIIFLAIKLNIVGGKIESIKTVMQPLTVRKDSRFAKRMARVKQRLGDQLSEEDRTAVLEASALVEQGLALMGHKEPSFRTNVENVPNWQGTTVDEIMRAFAVRTRIVHFPKEPLPHADAERAVNIFEAALKSLRLI